MTDEELAMAYADGELDAIAAKRLERRMADEPALAEAVAAHRALRDRLGNAFAPIAEEPVPDRFAGLLQSNVVPLRRRQRAMPLWWGGSVAAALALGLVLGHLLPEGDAIVNDGNRMVAASELRQALDRQLASETGPTQVLASFRGKTGAYCRIFRAEAAEGVACHEGDDWPITLLKSTDTPRESPEYRQAASASPQLLALAQDMMAGDPLDPDEERGARDKGWR